METLVIKVGTSTLLGTNELPSKTFEHVAVSIQRLREHYNVILVTSGAIGFGVRQTGLDERPQNLHQLQALSMIGQVGLLRRWREAFGDTTVGQVLVTRQDLERATTAGLFRDSVAAVWQYNAVPIVNENDAVSTEEISFGDNDRLAAEVAAVLGAKRLVMLTDQDGIQAAFGTADQRRLEQVHIDEVDAHIHSTKSTHGKGGATSKVQAARIALEADVAVYVAHAATENAIEDALLGKVGTRIVY
jgi:glutamate 5-kinase